MGRRGREKRMWERVIRSGGSGGSGGGSGCDSERGSGLKLNNGGHELDISCYHFTSFSRKLHLSL